MAHVIHEPVARSDETVVQPPLPPSPWSSCMIEMRKWSRLQALRQAQPRCPETFKDAHDRWKTETGQTQIKGRHAKLPAAVIQRLATVIHEIVGNGMPLDAITYQKITSDFPRRMVSNSSRGYGGFYAI